MIKEDYESPDNSGGKWSEQGNKYETEDFKDGSDDNTEASEGDKAIKTPNQYDFYTGQDVMDREVGEKKTFQGAVSDDTSIPSELEMHGNDVDPSLQRSAQDRKYRYLYEPYFDGKSYGSQIFGVEMVNKMTTTRNLNRISVNSVFMQVLQTESSPEATGVHE